MEQEIHPADLEIMSLEQIVRQARDRSPVKELLKLLQLRLQTNKDQLVDARGLEEVYRYQGAVQELRDIIERIFFDPPPEDTTG